MVRVGGENISAQEIENVIDELPEMPESAIIPMPDEFCGEEVKAMVIRKRDRVVERDIVLQVALNLARTKCFATLSSSRSSPEPPLSESNG